MTGTNYDATDHPVTPETPAERIRRVKPWLKSTGPKTTKGKAISRMNALKHGDHANPRNVRHAPTAILQVCGWLIRAHVRPNIRSAIWLQEWSRQRLELKPDCWLAEQGLKKSTRFIAKYLDEGY